jgi:tetratricopeptide (TPR) repeat protein
MKVAVYAINLNYAHALQKWADCARDADYIIMADTGSTDNSIDVGLAAGIAMHSIVIDPWRYDHARNAALALVPDDVDYCIALDTDEFLQPGWRDALERAHKAGITRPRYRFIWSWKSPGVPDIEFAAEKIHPRHGYFWKHPAHETLFHDVPETQGWVPGLEIHHHQEKREYRSHALPLLEIAVTEQPNDDRVAFYYARELFFYGEMEKAKREFLRHISIASWDAEKAASYRYLYQITQDAAYLQAAVHVCPNRREAWVDLAKHYYDHKAWSECFSAATAALRINRKPLEYLCEDYAWGSIPHDLAAVAAYNMGAYHEAKHQGMEALKKAPYDDRLNTNLKFYREAAA